MKCNPLRWVWGLVPICALAWLVAQLEHVRIEEDLGRRVDAELAGTGFKWVRTGFSGRDGLITGRATDESNPQKAADIAQGVWGVRLVENRAELIERADAYSWWATLTQGRVTLHGLVPNEAAREQIATLARSTFQGVSVADQMRLARGVPTLETWLGGVGFAMKQLQGLKGGEARLDGLGLTVAGEAATQPGYTAIKTAIASNLPRGIRLIDDRVTPPVVRPYVWAVRAASGQVILTGNVPSSGLRQQIDGIAKQAFPRARVADRTEYGDGARTAMWRPSRRRCGSWRVSRRARRRSPTPRSCSTVSRPTRRRRRRSPAVCARRCHSPTG